MMRRGWGLMRCWIFLLFHHRPRVRSMCSLLPRMLFPVWNLCFHC